MKQEKYKKVGEKALDFTLYDQDKKEFTLSKYNGKRVLLSFHPLAWTSVCAKQMQSLEDNLDIFEELNTIALGISIDSSPSKKAWADFLSIKYTRLLADFWPHGKVAKQFGIFREKDGISERVNIIINEEQEIEYIQIYDISQLPDINEIIKVIDQEK
jgi:peroxiredoxin